MKLTRAELEIDGKLAEYRSGLVDDFPEGSPVLVLRVADYAEAEAIAATLERSHARKRGAKDPSPGPVAKSESPSGNGGARAEEAAKCIAPGCGFDADAPLIVCRDHASASDDERMAWRDAREAHMARRKNYAPKDKSNG